MTVFDKEPALPEGKDVQMPDGPSVPPVPLPTWAAINCPSCLGMREAVQRACKRCNGRGAVRVNLDDLPILEPFRS